MCSRISAAGELRVAVADGRGDRGEVVADRQRVLERGGADELVVAAGHGAVDAERDADPQPVLGRARERLVPADVDLGERFDVAGRAGLGDHRLERRDVARVRAPGGPGRVLALEVDAELRQVLERRAAQDDERRERVAEGRSPRASPRTSRRPCRAGPRSSRPPPASAAPRAASGGRRRTPRTAGARPAAARQGGCGRRGSPRAAGRARRRTSGPARPCRTPWPRREAVSVFGFTTC